MESSGVRGACESGSGYEVRVASESGSRCERTRKCVTGFEETRKGVTGFELRGMRE